MQYSGKLLLLGGTGEAKKMAAWLHHQGIAVVYSEAGKVRVPRLPCETRVGGFSDVGGLKQYLQTAKISAVLDMTHPYAMRMSEQAWIVCKQNAIIYWRYQRPAWKPQPGDDWVEFHKRAQLPALLANETSLLLTIGQVTPALVNALAKLCNQMCIRTAVPLKMTLPNNVFWEQGIGPFTEQQEHDLFAKYGVSALVTKNSGGAATVPKLTVARRLGVTVYVEARPDTRHLADMPILNRIKQCQTDVIAFFHYYSTLHRPKLR